MKVLLIGAERDGEIVTWPRHDFSDPCIFPIKERMHEVPMPCTMYFPHLLTTNQDKVQYRLASTRGYLYEREMADVAYRLLGLSMADLAKVRVGETHTCGGPCEACG